MQTPEELEDRIRTILPEEYQDNYEEVQPVSMGSAGLKYGRDGKVAWSDIWETFCDLAMAGGPPHKGTLLQPGTAAEIVDAPERYCEVADEICRGIRMVADVAAEPGEVPGWVQVECENEGMAAWLARAIVMENVSAHCEGRNLALPAGPTYRIEKEIKNVVTVIAKTCHYWLDHMWSTQQREISELFAKMDAVSPLLQPAVPGYGFHADAHRRLSDRIVAAMSFPAAELSYPGWLGLECPDVRAAIWMMRALVVSNVLARREGTVLFVPVNPVSDPEGEIVVRAVAQVRGFAHARGVL